MRHEDIIRQMDWWNSEIDIEPLAGGITNHNYIVSRKSASAEEKYVVRLGTDIPVHHILRFNEIAAGQAAFEAGLSPAIRHHESGVLVMDYIPSTALTAAQIKSDVVLEQVLAIVKRTHRELPLHLRGASVVFWVFHVIRDYAASLRAGGSAHVALLDDLLSAAAELEESARPFDIVFGHNDLLAANFLDDGQRLWLIDWEYGGFNTPLFDLGGVASNNELTEVQEHWLLENYFECPLSDNLWIRYKAMKSASLLRETMWSMISELHSDIDFDYGAYSAEYLERFEQVLGDFRGLSS